MFHLIIFWKALTTHNHTRTALFYPARYFTSHYERVNAQTQVLECVPGTEMGQTLWLEDRNEWPGGSRSLSLQRHRNFLQHQILCRKFCPPLQIFPSRISCFCRHILKERLVISAKWELLGVVFSCCCFVFKQFFHIITVCAWEVKCYNPNQDEQLGGHPPTSPRSTKWRFLVFLKLTWQM